MALNYSYSTGDYSPESMTGERLYTVMPRSTVESFNSSGTPQYTSNRGKVASLRLLTSNREVSLKDREGKRVNIDRDLQTLLDDSEGFKNFLLTDVAVAYSEKIQVTTTFGDNEVVYYFGKQPVIFNLSGMLFDSIYSDWFTKFITLYQTTLRGSQLAKRFELVELVLPNMRLIGSIQSLSHQQNSARDTDIYFSMQFLAKEVIPIAIPDLSGKLLSNITGSLIDFSVGKAGVGGAGYKLSIGIGSGLNMSGDYALGNILSEIRPTGFTEAGVEFSKALNEFRTSIFSPIYGIVSSITKIIKTTEGDISGIIKNFTDPVNLILRDINYIATEAVAIANLIESSVNDVISIPDRVVQNTRNTIYSLKNSAGVISRVPESLAEVFQRHFKSGRIKQGAAILSSGKNKKNSKAAVLSSGAPYSPLSAYKL